VELFLGDDRVGRATVRADGSFDATVGGPNGQPSPRAIYRASVASFGSAPVRLSPRTVQVIDERATRRGLRVTFAGPPRRPLVVARMPGCRRGQAQPPRTLHTDGRGFASVTLERPSAGDWPWAYVAWSSQGAGKSAAYSLPVIVRSTVRH
jgi:hypothetical protein